MIKKINNSRKLNLGCGRDIKTGYINIDKSKTAGVDVAHDLDKYPWPFKDNYFDEVYGRDVIEHVKDLFRAMKGIPTKMGWLLPPIPLPRFLFPNVLNLRHLVSYLLGEIIIKIDFTLRVAKE